MAIEVTPTPGQAIQTALLAQMEGRLESFPSQPGFCLRNVRLTLMAALDLSEGGFWRRFAHTLADDHPQPIESYWARDVQVSLRTTRGVVQVMREELQGGDLYLNWKLGRPEGHCAVVLVGGDNPQIVENTSTQRGNLIRGYNRLSPLSAQLYPEAQEFFRILEV